MSGRQSTARGFTRNRYGSLANRGSGAAALSATTWRVRTT